MVERPNVIVRLAVRVWCWLFLACGWYYRHSRRYRLAGGRERYRGHVPTVGSVSEMSELMASARWTEDGLRRWWDAIGWPLEIVRTGEGDCDEFAVLALDAGRVGVCDDSVWSSSGGLAVWYPWGLLTVVYATGRVSVAGHNVGVFKNDGRLGVQEFAHASNWGWRGWFGSLDEVARNVAGEQPLLAWSLAIDDVQTGKIVGVEYRWVGGLRAGKGKGR